MNNDDLAGKITKNLINTLSNKKLTLKEAESLIKNCENKAEELGIPVVITVLDNGGNLIAEHRMDDALLISISASFNKAYTSLALKMPTSEVYKLVQPGMPFYGLESIIPGKMCVFAGGLPIMHNNVCIGGIGVSGGTTEQDDLIVNSAFSD
ncbi:MAG: heme-binding protein [Clostridium sp.]|nr:heme-binding protein [Clostridium sp.]